VTALILGATCGCGGEPEGDGPTNLLFVVFDTTRADHLGCYGYEEHSTSPTLDRLAEEGLVLDRAYSASSLTPVSAGSFLTGTLPYRHGVRSLFVVGKQSLEGELPSLFGLLGEAGLETAAFVSAKPMGRQYALDRGFDFYDDDWSTVREQFGISRFADAPQRPGDATCDLALEWLDDSGVRPFALMVHFFDAHDSSFVPPEDFLAEHLDFDFPRGLGRNPRSFPLEGIEELQALYDAEIRFMDEQLARLLAKLEELGVRDRTLVCVLADHGECFGEHGYFTHGWLSEHELRVPIVLAGPGVPAGLRLAARARTVDLLPTVAELFGLDAPGGVDGESVLDLLAESGEGLERDVYAEVHHAPADPRGREPAMHTLVVGPWKYVHRPSSGRHELYHLVEDPEELDNRVATEPDVAGRLLARMVTQGALGGEVSLEGLSEETLRALRDLGYLGGGEDQAGD